MGVSPINSLSFGKTVYAVVGNFHGLHFAPCKVITEITRKIKKPVYFSHEGDVFEKDVNGSMIGLFLMEFARGDKVAIRVGKDYPDYALRSIVNCVRARDNYEIALIKKGFMEHYYERLS